MTYPLLGLSEDEVALLAASSGNSLAAIQARQIVKARRIEAERRLQCERKALEWHISEERRHARAMAPPAPPTPPPGVSRAEVIELVHQGLEAAAKPIVEYVAENLEPIVEAIEGTDRKLTGLKGTVMDIQQRPHMRYRGVFDLATRYEPGDTVTRHGAMWHANRATVGEAPGNGPSSWTMMNKSQK